MRQLYSWDHLWRHPEKYIRMDKNDLKNNESVLNLCEMILISARRDCESILKALRLSPHDDQIRQQALDMDRYLRNNPVVAMSFGGSVELAKQFRKNCPGGLFTE